MPENTNQFTDIISAEVDVQSFQNSLNQLKTVYENFIAGLDETTRKGLGLGFSQTFSVAVKELSGSLAEFRKDLVGSIGQLEGNISQVFEILQANVAKSTGTSKKLLKDLGDEAEKTASKVKGGVPANDVRIPFVPPDPKEKLARTISDEQEGILTKASQDTIKGLADAIKQIESAEQAAADRVKARFLKNQQEVGAATLDRLNQEAKASAKAGEEEEAIASRVRDNFIKSQQEMAKATLDRLAASAKVKNAIDTEFERIEKLRTSLGSKELKEGLIDDKLLVGSTKTLEERFSVLNALVGKYKHEVRLANEQLKDSKAEGTLQEQIQAQAKLNSLKAVYTQLVTQATNAKKQLDAKEEAENNKRLKELEAELALRKKIADAEAAVGKSQKERSFAEVSGPNIDNIRKRLALLSAEIEAAKKRLQDLFSQESRLKGSDPFSAERLNNLKEIVKETDNLNKHQRQLNSVTESNKKATEGFFSHMLHGFKNTTSLVIRFYTVFALLQAAIDLIKFTIGAPFEILADGLKYMQGIEESASDLVGVLAANVVFSKDLAENFKIAKETSVDLVQLLKQRSVATGTTFDALSGTFKALLQGGGLQVVGTLEELVKLAELFQQSLSAAGVGGLAAQGSIQEIAKLFSGVPNDYNKFLSLLKITPAEWQKIVKEAKTHRDLLDRLPDTVKNYSTAVELARLNQARLTKEFGELIDRIGGEGSKPLFDFITKQLSSAVEFIESKFNQIVSFTEALALGIKFIAQEIISAVSGTGDSLDLWLNAFLVIEQTILRVTSALSLMGGVAFDAVSAIIKATAARADGNLKPAEESIKNIAKRFEDFAKDAEKIEAIGIRSLETFNRPIVSKEEQEKAIKDLEKLQQRRKDLVNIFSNQGGKNAPPSIVEKYTKQLEDLDGQIALTSSIAKSSNLNKVFDFNPPPGITEKTKGSRDQLRSILEEFRLAREQFNEDAEEIREKAKTVRDNIRQEVTDRVLSEREAAVFLTASIEEEKKQLDDLRNKVAETAGSIASKIAKQISDPEIRKRGLITLDKEFTAFRKQQVKSDFQLNNEIITQQRKAGKEKVAIDQEVVEDRRRIQEQAIKSSLELLSIAREAGILTETQYFDQVRELEEEQLEIEKARLQERLTLETAATDERLKLLNQLKLVEQKIADFRSVTSERVQRNTERDLQLARDYAQALAQADFARQQNQLQFINELRPEAGFNSIIIEGINLRAKELDLLEKNLQIQLDIAAAKNSETEETRRLTVQLANLRNERDQLFEVEVREILRGTRRSRPSISGNQDDFSFFGNFIRGAQGAAQAAEPGSTQGAINDAANRELARRRLAFAEASASRAGFLQANPNLINDPKAQARLAILDLEVKRTADAARDFRVKVLEGQLKPGFANFKRGVLDGLFGPGIVQRYKDATTTQDKLAAASDGAVNALANIGAIISNIQQGTQNGGTLGGIGAGISGISSVLGSGLLQSIPFVGKFLPAIGGILSFVGGLFAASAKKIAADVKKNFQNTIENYQNGNASLVSTIQLLEQQRLSAITRLSGSKTGKKELESILPEFDNQLQQLRKTQQEVIGSFDDALFILRENSDVLSNVNKQWQDINKQVKDYIGAGGDAAKAAEFLSLNLLKIRKDAASELESAEQEAIQEAIKLNDLLKERQKIVDEFSKKEFDIINKNAIERRKSNTVQAAEELNAARKQRDEDLANIDNEIRLGNQKLERQKEIFSLAADTASLRRRDEELSLAALDAQIARLKDLRSIVQSISIGPNGLATSSLLPAAPTQININITGLSDNQAGAAIADSLSNELERRFRIVPVS